MNARILASAAFAAFAASAALPCMADDADGGTEGADGASTAEIYHFAEMGRFAKRAQDFDVGDYVQTGLVLHYDGIRNAGASLPHDSEATTWKNLVDGQPDAEFVGETGAWDESGLGYAFNGTQQAYAQTKSAVTLGESATIQIATDADPSANTAKYTGLFRSYEPIKDNLTFWSGNGNDLATITFKADNYGVNKKSRPTLSGWNGKYVTAILGDGNAYIFQGTTLENDKTRTSNTAVQEAPYLFGGGDENTRWFKGVYHSVRVYTAALTEEQLARNRFVDDIRFRGAAFEEDIVVASSVAVPEDAVAVGAYMVNGSHTFTRPASVTVGDATWNADGYTLEKWDAETKTWGAAETGEGDSFEYVNCEANGKMRLTWNWTLASGAKKLDADDYAQNGLVLNFDGISNAGLGTHDAAAATWANLGSLGSSRDAAKTALPETYWHPNSAAGVWTRTAFDFKCRDYFLLKGAASIGAQATAQVAARHDIWGTIDKFVGKIGSVEIKWPMFFGAYDLNDQFQAYLNIADAGNRGKVWSFTAGVRDNTAAWDGRMINLSYDASGEKRETLSASTAAGWAEGTNKSLTEGTAIGGHTLAIGTGYGANASDAAARILNGKVHAVRVYDRILSDAEISRNRAIDEARFYDSIDALEEDDAVLVRSESLGDGAWTEGDGAYIIRKASKTFTAPASCTAADGAKYTCTGYRLETWNATRNRWEDGATGTDLSYSIDNTGEGVVKKRLSWLWTMTEGVVPSDAYTTFDYAQKDLLLHFDGIRNAGVAKAHDAAVATWANLGLSGSANDATKTALASSVPDKAVDGAWTYDGYTFGGKEYFAVKGTLALGSAVTVQSFSGDYDMANQVSDYPHFFGATSKNEDYFGLYFNLKSSTDEAKKTLNVKVWNVAAHSAATTWTRPYAMTMYDTLNKTVYVGDEIVPAWQTANTDNPLTNAWTYAIGTSRNKDSVRAARIFVGTIGYTRVYTNVLDTAQLVRNRFIDEVRYRPNVIVVNGAVGETGTTGKSSRASGGYYAVGDLDFAVSASELVVDGRRYVPCLLVEKEVGGEWTKVYGGRTESYSVSPGDDPLRLTWTWAPPRGLKVILR